MMSCLYIGATGMKTHDAGLNVVSNNLANVNTVAYKQQSYLFQDMVSQTVPSGTALTLGSSQVGMGSAVGDIRTKFTEGSYEEGSSVTDLFIGGKGFFQVTSDDKVRYTRAGNFNFDKEGWLKDPSGFVLSGQRIENGQPAGDYEPIQIDRMAIRETPGRVTTEAGMRINIGAFTNNTNNEASPAFSLLDRWDGNNTPPLPAQAYTTAQHMTCYDETGQAHSMTLYVDGVSEGPSGRTYEYILAMDPPSEDGGPSAGTPGAGLSMTGTFTFTSSGELTNMSAFTSTSTNKKDLANWTPASLVNGLPQVVLQFKNSDGASLPPQTTTMDLGLQNSSNAWNNAVASAAEIGTELTHLPSMNPVKRTEDTSTTAIMGESKLWSATQNGNRSGSLINLEIGTDGLVQAVYSNSESVDLYNIPLFRFTSEDGLRRDGDNHYTATDEAGQVESGTPGTSNYGKLFANKLETSNVDMSREFVSMIMVQRGFQMNSKTVSTADTMLQKALELKRT